MIALKIDELMKNNKTNEEIVEETDKYISEMQTFFVAESLPSGDIELKTKSVGKKVYKKLVDI